MSRIFLFAALLPLVASAAEPAIQQVTITEARDSEWQAYRVAYKSAAGIAQITRARPLIQAHMQIRARDLALPLDGLHITLAGATTTLDIPVDAIGRATLPMIKQAYDEDAVLRLNRRAGFYRFSGRFTIRERDDGVYSTADLRAACEQLLSAQRENGGLFRLLGKKCAGVRFVYPRDDGEAGIAFRGATGSTAIAAADGQPFDTGPMGVYKVAIYRFADWPQQGEVLAKRPLAISTVYQ